MTQLGTLIVLTARATRGWGIAFGPRFMVLRSPNTNALFPIPLAWLNDDDREGDLRTALLILVAVHGFPFPEDTSPHGGPAALN